MTISRRNISVIFNNLLGKFLLEIGKFHAYFPLGINGAEVTPIESQPQNAELMR